MALHKPDMRRNRFLEKQLARRAADQADIRMRQRALDRELRLLQERSDVPALLSPEEEAPESPATQADHCPRPTWQNHLLEAQLRINRRAQRELKDAQACEAMLRCDWELGPEFEKVWTSELELRRARWEGEALENCKESDAWVMNLEQSKRWPDRPLHWHEDLVAWRRQLAWESEPTMEELPRHREAHEAMQDCEWARRVNLLEAELGDEISQRLGLGAELAADRDERSHLMHYSHMPHNRFPKGEDCEEQDEDKRYLERKLEARLGLSSASNYW
mmetsp:Transcript_98182/g.179948  ORF Transcript_98182/g.179948 Transcript_98182/m.179948 type:complete len:276 (-) Transcript_98182:26-853(-)